jgi:hypothetical protein
MCEFWIMNTKFCVAWLFEGKLLNMYKEDTASFLGFPEMELMENKLRNIGITSDSSQGKLCNRGN